MKILNLYAGIGGNRKLWGDDHEIVAIENNKKIAEIYHDFFPQDLVLVEDAHQYLLEHFKEFDFIWSSPPCPTHSTFAKLRGLSDDFGRGNYAYKPKYPEMDLYQEIIFLQHFFKGKWAVENVVGYYEPLIKPQRLQRHYFWTNYYINPAKFEGDNIKGGKIKEWEQKLGVDLSRYKGIDKRVVLRNCVAPELGQYILERAFSKIQQKTLI